MTIKRTWQKALRILGSMALSQAATLLARSLRVQALSSQQMGSLVESGAVFAFWHGGMFLPWYFFRAQNISALISRSSDGDLLAKVLKNWKYAVIRGSSSKGGKESFDALLEIAKNKKSIAITPDGPKGPSHKFKAGAVVIAQRANVPLVLVGSAYKKKVKFHSWDGFEIPYPFSKVALALSDPISIGQTDDVSLSMAQAEEELKKLVESAKKCL